jgi:plasmid stability protein
MAKEKGKRRVALFMDERTRDRLKARAKKNGRTMVEELRRMLTSGR